LALIFPNSHPIDEFCYFVDLVAFKSEGVGRLFGNKCFRKLVKGNLFKTGVELKDLAYIAYQRDLSDKDGLF